jgi:hypothetical protein
MEKGRFTAQIHPIKAQDGRRVIQQTVAHIGELEERQTTILFRSAERRREERANHEPQ